MSSCHRPESMRADVEEPSVASAQACENGPIRTDWALQDGAVAKTESLRQRGEYSSAAWDRMRELKIRQNGGCNDVEQRTVGR